MSHTNQNVLSAIQSEALLNTLKTRFEDNMKRHPAVSWADVAAKLAAHPEKLWSLHEMEQTGGEPDVVGRDDATGEFIFFDCADESPIGRRSLCYDGAALAARKKNKPEGSAQEMAAAMGVALLTETEYRALQKLGHFDTKTSSWIETPADIRELGGALFGDFRYNHVFFYHNGADSYYASRGFRSSLRV